MSSSTYGLASAHIAVGAVEGEVLLAAAVVGLRPVSVEVDAQGVLRQGPEPRLVYGKAAVYVHPNPDSWGRMISGITKIAEVTTFFKFIKLSQNILELYLLKAVIKQKSF
jgi:hypothetical protein